MEHYCFICGVLFNCFIDPVYAVEKLFYDLAINFLDAMQNMAYGAEKFAGEFMKVVLKAINGIITGVNWLINALNSIEGVNINLLSLFDSGNIHPISNAIGHLKDNLRAPVSDKAVLDFSGARLDQLDYKDAFDKGFDIGESWGDGIDNAISGALNGIKGMVNELEMEPGLEMPNTDELTGGGVGEATNSPKGTTVPKEATLPKVGNAPKVANVPTAAMNPNLDKVGKVGEVGKINDEVDISSEDLKLMRELAELRNIQNFVSLTPTVQVKTGDIKEEANVKKLVAEIERSLEDEIASSAKGVYAI